jgi:hypothetical protein
MGEQKVCPVRSPGRAKVVTSARWLDVRDELTTGIAHLDNACRMFDEFLLVGDDLRAYANRMALMHAMQAGYTSIEAGLDRILHLLGEERPQGADWHKALLRRVASPLAEERPAVLSAELYRRLDDLHRFRHVASRTYDTFEPGQAHPAVDAARHVVANLMAEVDAFQAQVDPPG